MAEEKPLFLIDIDRAIEGLETAAPKKGSVSAVSIEPLIMHSVDLANALDGAGLDTLSEMTSELAQCFKKNDTQSFLMLDDLVSLVRSEVAFTHPSVASGVSCTQEQLNQAKVLFAANLSQIKNGLPITKNPDALAQDLPAEATLDMTQEAIETISSKEEELVFSKALISELPASPVIPTIQELSPEPSIAELSALFAPRLYEESPVVFIPPEPKAFSFPEGLTRPLERENALDYSGSQRFLDKHFSLDRTHNLNRMQIARSLVTKTDNWNAVELDFLLGREQDELTKAGQQSLRHVFENLTEELLIDEVYADPEIVQQLVTIISILPPCPSIFAVQQDLMIFIDLDHISLSAEHLLSAGKMMAEIGGSLEMHHEGVRLSCPSSLLRMPMVFFGRHGQNYAISAIQYLGEEPLNKAVDSKVDALGEILHPARMINLLVGNQHYSIYAHEFLGVQNMNIHLNIPKLLERPYWLAGIALDGMNNVYPWVALDRFTK
ncbi:hypothetical protein CL55_00004210 [Polynucleobacter duraquae]|jgi:hypothetical protein|uniref:Uncharacterized protein n=1 Tax=Polynucleobacter duraquae TaxID=1835254 RepID=A0A0E3UZW6_9BURK|nr:hypothetical protein [Polynucleobacter duraquae]AKD24754.1 hypothetical protein CL55_00004210 [Polynucleobacter duraquae]